MLRWFDGFDSYPSADLVGLYNIVGTGGGTTFQTVPSIGRFGSGAVRGGGAGGGEVLAKFFAGQPTWVVGVAFKFNIAGKASRLITLQALGQPQVELWMTVDNILRVTSADGVHVLGTGTTSLLSNTFYFLEFKATIGTAGSFQARIGGRDEIALSAGNTDPLGLGVATRVVLWADQFQLTMTYDDLYICDGTGTANNDFLGDMRVEDLHPVSAGAHADYAFTGAASATAAVNEVAEDGDTSYVHSETVGDKQTYLFGPLSSAPTAVAGVQLSLVARKDDAGVRALAPVFRAAGADHAAGLIPLTDSYGYATYVAENNPASGLPWTGDEVDAIEAGFVTAQ